MENFFVAKYMLNKRGVNRGSIITGSSVHNSRVERIPRDIYSSVLYFYYNIFEQLKDEGVLDILNDIHIYCLHLYLKRIQSSLNELVNQLNNRPMSTERNFSPLQLWESGMLENINSESTVLKRTYSFGRF